MLPNPLAYQEPQETNAGVINLALVGGDSGCKAFIKFLETHTLRHSQVCIVGVADPREDCPCLVYARNKGIYTTKDFRDFFTVKNLHLLIELTGRDDVLDEIMKLKPRDLRVMGHLSAKLLWEVIELLEDKIVCERRSVHSERLTTIGRMASYLAHEIRNPLVSIGGFATTILNAPELHASLRPKANIIVDEVKRLERVLKNMREYVRPLHPNKTTASFNKLVAEAYIKLEPELRSSGVEMRITLDPEMPDCLLDRDLMLEALLAFTRRFIKFMHPGDELTVRTEVCWDTIGVYVKENAARIPPAVLENLFNPFSDRHNNDPGLDLAMAKKIIEDHGGDIKIIRKAEIGTTVIIELPVELS